MTPRLLGATRLAPVLLASSALVAGTLGLAAPSTAQSTTTITFHVSVPEGLTAAGLTARLDCGDPDDEYDAPGTNYCDNADLDVPPIVLGADGDGSFSGVVPGTKYDVFINDKANPQRLSGVYDTAVPATDGASISFDLSALDDYCTALPTFTGSGVVGSTLSATGAAFTWADYDGETGQQTTKTDQHGGQVTYTWERVDASDPTYGYTIYDGDEPYTGTTYQVTAEDAGETIRARASFDQPGQEFLDPDRSDATCYSSNDVQVPAEQVQPTPPAPSAEPVIAPGTPVPGAVTPTVTGKVKKGKAVSAGVSVPAGATASYQWYRTFKKGKKTVTQPIAGATGSTYKPKGKDVGDKIFVVVSYSSPGYAATTLTSAPKKVK